MSKDTKQYISQLAEEAPKQNAEDIWYCIAACAFTASNSASHVADVYRTAIEPFGNDVEKRRMVLIRIKESLLKTAVIYGVPRCINAFRALISAIPDAASNDTSSIRKSIPHPFQNAERGEKYMRNIFRADMDPFLSAVDEYWPDLRVFIVDFIYGYYQSDLTIIDAITTSQLNIATLIPMMVTDEIAWHFRGLVRNGGAVEQINYALGMTRDICEMTGLVLKDLPNVEEVVNQERLF